MNFAESSYGGLNEKRRHLSESQRAMVAAKIANLPVGANQHAGEGTSIEAASDLMNVSRRAVQSAAAVQKHGSPELVQAVERGEVGRSPWARGGQDPGIRPRPVSLAYGALCRPSGHSARPFPITPRLPMA